MNRLVTVSCGKVWYLPTMAMDTVSFITVNCGKAWYEPTMAMDAVSFITVRRFGMKYVRANKHSPS